MLHSSFLTKVILVSLDSHFRQKMLKCFKFYCKLFIKCLWPSHSTRLLVHLQLKEPLITKGMNSPHPDYVLLAVGTEHDWDLGHEINHKKEPILTVSIEDMKAEAEGINGSITVSNIIYFTNGSVDPITRSVSPVLHQRTIFSPFEQQKRQRLLHHGCLCQCILEGVTSHSYRFQVSYWQPTSHTRYNIYNISP